MSSAQKIIKYLALAFASFLIFIIITSIISGMTILSNIFDGNNDNNQTIEKNESLISDWEDLNIDLATSDLIIKEGNEFKVETTNKYITSKEENNKLYITEKKHNVFKKENDKVIIYLNENQELDNVKINQGAGKVTIEKLNAEYLSLDLGAGKSAINNLNIKNSTKIDTGMGKTTIKNSILNNLNLETGIGKTTLSAELLGTSKIDNGIGKTSIKLIGSGNDYQINIDKGIGSYKVNGKSINDNPTIGNGINKLNINGGIGSISLDFIEKY